MRPAEIRAERNRERQEEERYEQREKGVNVQSNAGQLNHVPLYSNSAVHMPVNVPNLNNNVNNNSNMYRTSAQPVLLNQNGMMMNGNDRQRLVYPLYPVPQYPNNENANWIGRPNTPANGSSFGNMDGTSDIADDEDSEYDENDANNNDATSDRR
eukprot:2851557-Rhodomonas_salina.1